MSEGLKRWIRSIPLWQYLLPLAIGVFVRLYDIPSQILLDDEWHSLNFVVDKTIIQCLQTQGMGANCIPINFYNRLMLSTVGWSEVILRLPSLAFGIFALILFPLLIRRVWQGSTAGIFAWLLAISPCVTFYSRLVRPYSMVLFFGFLAFLCSILWMKKQSRILFLTYSISAFLAIFFHLYAAICVITPLVCLFVFYTIEKFAGIKTGKTPLPSVIFLGAAAAIIAVLCGVFIVPPLLANPWFMKVMGEDKIVLQTFAGLASLQAGTSIPALICIFFFFALLGLVFCFKSEFRTALVIAAVYIAFFLFCLLARQDDIHVAIVIARFGIILFPISFLLVALGVSGIFKTPIFSRVPRIIEYGAVVLIIGCYIWVSPLWHTYAQVNNFTNHSAFQDSYLPHDWSKSRVRALEPTPQMSREDIPSFYFTIDSLGGAAGIIEYPMYMGDNYNRNYYYQHFHKKAVAVGFIPEFVFPQMTRNDDFVYGNLYIDYVLSRLFREDRERCRFRNMVPLTQMKFYSSRFKNWLIVYHKDLDQECFPNEYMGKIFSNDVTSTIRDRLINDIGPVLYESSQLIVWRIM